jgi:predicted Zn-dependent protease
MREAVCTLALILFKGLDVRALGVTLVIFVGLSSLGCGSTPSQSTWVFAQGGIVQDTRLNRAQAAFSLLGPAADKTVRIHVLDNDAVGAYGWPNGNLFVTRGLVDLLSDQELVAAIAHEMGHLLNEGHLHTVVSLRGCSVSSDAEARADSIGVRLLDECGIGRGAMISMLNKVRLSPGMPSSCEQGIGRRIELLTENSESNH